MGTRCVVRIALVPVFFSLSKFTKLRAKLKLIAVFAPIQMLEQNSIRRSAKRF